ncbi:hypothetical protein HKD37_09G026660 [Glycine soja]
MDCGESSLSALKAAKVRWPGLFDGVDSATEDWIIDQMHTVRPVVETGYENVAEGLTVEGILENWSKLKPIIMEEWDEKRDDLIDLFGKVRDEWLEQDFATWIGANRLYPGVSDALKFASSRVYIVTTKQSLPEWLYHLKEYLALELGNWGYNTRKEREGAAAIPRIHVLGLSDFSKNGKFGNAERKDREMGHLYALDFDGVICDSCGETAISALKAAKLRWPPLFDGVDSTIKDWIVDQMITVRPVVETGYETLLLVRLLLETRVPSIRKSSVSEGLTVEDILENWFKLKPIIMEEWNENREELIDLFGKVRDDWLYSSKQSRFADALLRELAGSQGRSVKEASENARTPRADTTVKILCFQRPFYLIYPLLSFVEDRLAILKNVVKEPELDNWNLYLVNWGFNTQKEREEAEANPRIQVIELSDFSSKLK